MTKALSLLILAAGLAGCGATPSEYRNDKETPLPPGQGAFGSSMTWEWRKKEDPATAPATAAAPAAIPASASEQEAFKKWRDSAGRNERQEFEEWRAWQDWKRKNPK